MHIEQMYTNCLAEAAYFIESDGEAVIIDPIREIAPYMEKARQRGVKIKYVFETHFHADFVSGHIDLAAQTGAEIVFGPGADTNYEAHIGNDGEEFRVGKITLKLLHTPGHTPESTCYLLFDEQGKEHAVFTGDTLFVGDVGRPDLLDGTMTKEELAGMMYDSLNNKIKKLADNVLVYPAHGPGSACGKNIGKETWSTIGDQKKSNYALQEMSKEKFIELVTADLTPPPAYFFKDAMINKNGYENIDVVIQRNTKALSVQEFKNEIFEGALILDTRIPDNFERSFIEGSVNIGLNGTYAVWVGTLLDINTPLIIVADEGKEEESILRLARVGYEKVKGFLKGGIDAWIEAGEKTDKVDSIDPGYFSSSYKEGANLLDVRNIKEWDGGIIQGATLISLSKLEEQAHTLSKDSHYYVQCAGGYRSMIASSILKRLGINNITNIRGGMAKIRETGFPLVTPVLK